MKDKLMLNEVLNRSLYHFVETWSLFCFVFSFIWFIVIYRFQHYGSWDTTVLINFKREAKFKRFYQFINPKQKNWHLAIYFLSFSQSTVLGL